MHLWACGHSSAHTHTHTDLNFGTPRAYDLLIMNLNPLFWVNELKEIGQRMKATGPINSILWCITLAHHSTRPLCAFCLYPLCYSLIILSGVRVRVANCADCLSLRMAKDSPNTDTPPDCAHPPWITPIITILWFFFLSLSLFILSLCSSAYALRYWATFTQQHFRFIFSHHFQIIPCGNVLKTTAEKTRNPVVHIQGL